MNHVEIRDPIEARRYALQSLCLSRVLSGNPTGLFRTLDWAAELAAEHYPLPPLGYVADIGHLATGATPGGDSGPEPSVLEPALVRRYEDYVLGRYYADLAFERAADAIARYRGRDRARSVAFLINQLRERAGFGGVWIVPAVLKQLQQESVRESESLLAEGRQALLDFQTESTAGDLRKMIEEIITAVRNTAHVLGAEDVFELETGTAIAHFGQRLALRQVIQAVEHFRRALDNVQLRPRPTARQVAARISDEDLYPIGGYSSISNKGSMESLLHSQLAYMEAGERPDLFDIKFVRDELYFYSRDENQFWRRRQTFVFAIFPDLGLARTKDPQLPWQRMILMLSLLTCVVKQLIDVLSEDALVFEFQFLRSESHPALSDEQELLRSLLQEQIANGAVVVAELPRNELAGLCEQRAQHSLCHVLYVSGTDRQAPAELKPTELENLARIAVDGPCPRFGTASNPLQPPEVDSLDGWTEVLQALLHAWI